MKDWIDSLVDGRLPLVAFAIRLGVALGAGVLVYLVGLPLRALLLRLIARGRFSPTHRSFFRGLFSALTVLVAVLVVLDLLELRGLASGLLAGGGITAIVLGFAFKELGENFLAGFLLAFSRPFRLGDLIRSGEFEGEVKGVELRCTHIRSADGRDIYLPNSQILTQPLVNFTLDGLRRPSVRVGVDYGDDPGGAVEAALAATRTVDGVLAEPGPRATVAELAASFVVLELTFWVDTVDRSRGLLAIKSDVQRAIHAALRDGGYTFSSNVTTAVELRTADRLQVALEGRG